MDFVDLVKRATGFVPYPYQIRLATEGLPELLRAPTGSGKTVAAVLPWLYRRRFHPEEAVRHKTPHWLVVALPLRTLVDQVEREVMGWLESLDLSNTISLHVLMGGRVDEARRWTEAPDGDAIMIGSIDMLLSRAMNRGYASSRFHWPIDFGVFNSGTQWVFDEVQLLGPALPTSRQLQALRDSLGTALPTRSMWMSATVSPGWMHTVDAPEVASMVEISDEDRQGSLGSRTYASRTFGELVNIDPKVPATVADAVIERHREGTRTICIVNTVAAARGLYAAVTKGSDIDTVLVHSRYRPADRAAASERALDDQLGAAGRIVVTTQALEAGVDITSSTLITEAAPWTSIVQRAGRCNRYGETDVAQVWWYPPAKPNPYESVAVEETIETLRDIEGQSLTGEQLAARALETQPDTPVLRRRDIIDLFDTTPTLSGDDIDVSPYIRNDKQRDVFVGWLPVPESAPDPSAQLSQEELCRAPIGEVADWLKRLDNGNRGLLWRFDPEGGVWLRLRRPDLRPGMVVLADAAAGGYTTELGWVPKSSASVMPVVASLREPTEDFDAASDEAAGDDPLSRLGSWVTLADHLADTEQRARKLLDGLGDGLPSSIREAAVAAAALHDVGKVHPVFQDTMRESAGDHERPLPDEVWAKSSRARRSRHRRRHFRHELVSALMLSTEDGRKLLPYEADLCLYLIAAHHGRVRLALRALEHDIDPDGRGRPVVLGVVDGEPVPSLQLADGRTVLNAEMNVAVASLMGGEGSWARLALRLRDRPDLGPFRLAWLEAMVRLADWQASAAPSRTVPGPATRVVM